MGHDKRSFEQLLQFCLLYFSLIPLLLPLLLFKIFSKYITHGCFEFIECYNAVPVFVCLHHEALPQILVLVLASLAVVQVVEVVDRYVAVSVGINDTESTP